MGASYNGSTVVSKTTCVGSIPTAPAKTKYSSSRGVFCFIRCSKESSGKGVNIWKFQFR